MLQGKAKEEFDNFISNFKIKDKLDNVDNLNFAIIHFGKFKGVDIERKVHKGYGKFGLLTGFDREFISINWEVVSILGISNDTITESNQKVADAICEVLNEALNR